MGDDGGAKRERAPAGLLAEKYEIIKPIGKGKFAVVYRAKRVADGELVALKKIAVDSMDDKAREKCLKEVRLLQSLEHPNIVRYLDSLIEGDELIIVFEWAAAGDLKRQARRPSGHLARWSWLLLRTSREWHEHADAAKISGNGPRRIEFRPP